ncbi:kyphoscoliosis peptidase-like isoform X5 [Heptranchias perlo]|uniref:kyphoscoliosis peptidase-like isoform X5 n=1 Tax=Heptranchias perlo TaxID=212740 RepID=UPI00355A838A
MAQLGSGRCQMHEVNEQRSRRYNECARPAKRPKECKLDKRAYSVPTGQQVRKPATSLYENSSESSDDEEDNVLDKSERCIEREKHRGRECQRDRQRAASPETVSSGRTGRYPDDSVREQERCAEREKHRGRECQRDRQRERCAEREKHRGRECQRDRQRASPEVVSSGRTGRYPDGSVREQERCIEREKHRGRECQRDRQRASPEVVSSGRIGRCPEGSIREQDECQARPAQPRRPSRSQFNKLPSAETQLPEEGFEYSDKPGKQPQKKARKISFDRTETKGMYAPETEHGTFLDPSDFEGKETAKEESEDSFDQRKPSLDGKEKKAPRNDLEDFVEQATPSLEAKGEEANEAHEDPLDQRKPSLYSKGKKTTKKGSEASQEHKEKKGFANGQKYKLKEIEDDMFNLKSMKMNLKEFEALDVYACKIPVKSSVDKLVHELLQYASSDLEKVRVLWIWICCHIEYDVKGYHNKDLKSSESTDVMKSGKAVCAGYSGLFCQMCSIAGIECTEIEGYSKGYNYDVGKKFKGDADHSWNAVFLEGKWHFLDSTWGAGHVNETCTKFTYKYVEFYFFTHPTLFINNHFPMEEKWQLISPRISLKIFENMLFRTGDFYDLGLAYIHPDVQVVSTVNGRVIINIECTYPTLFMYSLDDKKDCAMMTLTKYGMKLEVLPDKTKDHKLKIYAKLWNAEDEAYSFVCAYLVKCDTIDESFKLPKAFHNPLGPSWLTESKGLLQPSHTEPLIYCDNGQCTVRFMLVKDLSFTSKLSCEEVNLSDEVMRNHVFKTQQGNWVEFKIQLPQSGLYVFTIFAKDKANPSPTHDHVCEYFISCTNQNVHWPVFPKIYTSWTEGCELIEPLTGILPQYELVKFKLKIPHVRKVQVYGKTACPLNMTKDGYWEGSCNTQDSKHLNVGVSDKMFDTKFTFALQYEVEDT